MLIALIAAAAIVKLIVLAQLYAHPLLQPRGDLDTSYYVELAQRVASGDVNLGGAPYFVSPLYVYVLGAVFAIFGPSLFAAQIVQVIGGVIAVWVIAWTARQWFGATVGLVAGALAILTGLFTFNEIAILQSSLDPLLTSVWLASLTRALHVDEAHTGARSIVWWGITGALIAVHALNRPNVLLCAIALVAALPLVWRSRVGVIRAAACTVGLALVLGIVVLRNVASFGEPLLITAHGGLNFYIGNHAGADGTYSDVPGITPSIRGQVRDARHVAEAARGRMLSEREVSSYFYDRAWEWIRAEPGRALALFLRKLAYTLNTTDLALNQSYSFFSRDESSLLRVLIVGPWCLVPLGLLGQLLAPKLIAPNTELDARRFVPWALMTPAYAISVALFFVSGRYRLPLLVPLVIVSAAVVVRAREVMTRATRSQVFAMVGALGVLTIVANWPWGLDDGRAEARTERIVAHIEAGEDDEARRAIEETAPSHPTPGLLHYRAARAWHARGAVDRAIAEYERALAIDRGQPEIAFNLGEALVANGQARDAIPHLEAACDRGVRVVRCTALLSKTLADLGAPQRARRRLAALDVPSDTSASELASLGSLALSLEQLDLADRWLRASLARDPSAAGPHEQYGLVLMLMHRPKEAIAAFTRACDLDPTNASAAYNLAVAWLDVNDRVAARHWLDEALRRQPNYDAARRLRSELEGR